MGDEWLRVKKIVRLLGGFTVLDEQHARERSKVHHARVPEEGSVALEDVADDAVEDGADD